MFSGGERPDRETMQAEMKKYSDARDEMIKAVLTVQSNLESGKKRLNRPCVLRVHRVVEAETKVLASKNI